MNTEGNDICKIVNHIALQYSYPLLYHCYPCWDIRASHGCLHAQFHVTWVSASQPWLMMFCPALLNPRLPLTSLSPLSLACTIGARHIHTHRDVYKKKCVSKQAHLLLCICGIWLEPQSDSGKGTENFTSFLNPFWAVRHALSVPSPPPSLTTLRVLYNWAHWNFGFLADFWILTETPNE